MTPVQEDYGPNPKALAPSIVEHFSIEGLFGYRDVAFTAPNAAAVLIAPNGAGKTTLMSALNAVLRRNFGKLRHIRFDQISIRLAGAEMVSFSQSIRALEMLEHSDLLASISAELGVEPSSLFNFIIEELGDLDDEELLDHPFVSKVLPRLGYNEKRVKKRLSEVAETIYSNIEDLRRVYEYLRDVHDTYDIVYLP